VYEKDDRIGGLLRYGIPDFKMEKYHIDRRLEQMSAEGTRFRPGVAIGSELSWDELFRRYEAVLIATGSSRPRDLAIEGRDLAGVHFAMDYLTQSNKVVAGDSVVDQIVASGKKVIILGGGDTGADCLGTATRQGAESVTTLAIGFQPPAERQADQPWPTFPNLFEIASAHEEFGERKYLANTVRFIGVDGKVTGVEVAETEVIDGRRVARAGTEQIIEADLVLLALGFTGPEGEIEIGEARVERDAKTNIARSDKYATNIDGVFAAGDAGRGQSLIVWAIAEGRAAAAAIDEYLEGTTMLPAPVKPSEIGMHA
jgi:glutamate synthase (NADPH/NADH) small chain